MILKDLHNKWHNIILNFNNKEYKLEIIKEKTEFVKKIISDNYYDNDLIFNRKEVSLQELLNLETIDFDQQTKIKTEIDELVGEMYKI